MSCGEVPHLCTVCRRPITRRGALPGSPAAARGGRRHHTRHGNVRVSISSRARVEWRREGGIHSDRRRVVVASAGRIWFLPRVDVAIFSAGLMDGWCLHPKPSRESRRQQKGRWEPTRHCRRRALGLSLLDTCHRCSSFSFDGRRCPSTSLARAARECPLTVSLFVDRIS